MFGNIFPILNSFLPLIISLPLSIVFIIFLILIATKFHFMGAKEK